MLKKIGPIAPQLPKQQENATSEVQKIATTPKRPKRKQAVMNTAQQTTSNQPRTSLSITK